MLRVRQNCSNIRSNGSLALCDRDAHIGNPNASVDLRDGCRGGSEHYLLQSHSDRQSLIDHPSRCDSIDGFLSWLPRLMICPS